MANKPTRTIDRAIRSIVRLLRSLTQARILASGVARRKVPVSTRIENIHKALNVLTGVEERIAAASRETLRARSALERRLAELQTERARHGSP